MKTVALIIPYVLRSVFSPAPRIYIVNAVVLPVEDSLGIRESQKLSVLFSKNLLSEIINFPLFLHCVTKKKSSCARNATYIL